jgi:putative transposase
VLLRWAWPLWACDFSTKDIWTVGGKATFYTLIFIHVGTR